VTLCSFAVAERFSCGVKNRPPGCSTLPTSALSAFTASAPEEAVGVRQRRAPDDRDRRTHIRELVSEPLDLLAVTPVTFPPAGVYAAQPLAPAVDECAARQRHRRGEAGRR